MKRIIALLIAMMIVLASSITVIANGVTVGDSSGDDMFIVILPTGGVECEITATEGYLEYGILNDQAIIKNCSSNAAGDFIIPDYLDGFPVTYIDDSAFSYCINLTSVKIPNTIYHIGNNAFSHCYSLINIEVPDNVTFIGDRAFYYCESLDDIQLPDNYCNIGSQVFKYTKYYENTANWQSGVLYIDAHLIEAIDTISTEYAVKEGTKNIAAQAFDGCNELTAINIPGSVICIGEDAFVSCIKLKSVIMADGVRSIGEEAFYSCIRLTDIALPDSVEYIGNAAFGGTAYYNIDSNWENGVLYIGNWLLYVNEDYMSGEYAIKSGTKGIGINAFSWCCGLKIITIPSSINFIGEDAFEGCDMISTVQYEGSRNQWNEIDICDGNENLTSTTIYFDYIQLIDISVEILGDNCTATLTNVPIGSSIIFVCYCDNKITYMEERVYEGDNQIYFVEQGTDNYDTIKIMVWNNLESCIPLCENEIISL